ncbi:MAG TPA: AMP-binding protein [Gaiellales bacterium]|nr:AMP-binding protein [Gaiellales bacterium]
MPDTIPELFDEAVAAAPSKVWLHADGRSFTFSEAHALVARAASAMSHLGVYSGDLVLATARNTPEYLFAWLATTSIGAIIVAVNPLAGEHELIALVRQVRPRLVVTDADAPAALREAGAAAIDVTALYAETPKPAPAHRPAPDDPAALIPTSGTTGRSKLVTQTHRAYAMAGEGFPWWMELGPDDRLMTSLPLFHVNAPAYSVLGSIATRAGLVLLPRFSASTFLDSARRHGATEFNAIGAMLEILMRQPVREDDADTPLRLCYTGPSPPQARQLEMERRFGLRIVCGYALSESPYGMIWPRGTRPFGTLGTVRQHPRLGIVNEARVVSDTGEVADGEVGELQLRNPAVMRGYWDMPDETAEVLDPDGWLRTGDLVHRNADGTYTFVGRRKEVIRRRGENVAPAEIEEALMTHADVTEAAVIGVPSDLTEEEIKGFVAVADPASADLVAIREAAAALLTPFKVPRYLEAVAELPHTPTGRIAKHELPRDRTGTEVDFDPRVRRTG